MGLPPRGYQPHGNHSPPRGFASSDPERQRELDSATEAGDGRTRRSAPGDDARQEPNLPAARKSAPVRQSAAGRAGNQPGDDEEGGSRR